MKNNINKKEKSFTEKVLDELKLDSNSLSGDDLLLITNDLILNIYTYLKQNKTNSNTLTNKFNDLEFKNASFLMVMLNNLIQTNLNIQEKEMKKIEFGLNNKEELIELNKQGNS